ncbi:MAG: hypothetical protein KDD61_14885 [Bdellovibrionales bacterium]|nr:hypothetical protein [Bdellovibrionales bacterium]
MYQKAIRSTFITLVVTGALTSSISSYAHCGSGWNTRVVPDRWGAAKFSAACDVHDHCYETCGTNRKTCDQELRKLLKKACRRAYTSPWHKVHKNSCLKVADIYYNSVRKNGSDPFKDAQKVCR